MYFIVHAAFVRIKLMMKIDDNAHSASTTPNDAPPSHMLGLSSGDAAHFPPLPRRDT